MLQTAPVLLVFPPTVGPYAKVDDSPLRFDFSGYGYFIYIVHVHRNIGLTATVFLAPFPPTRFMLGSTAISPMGRSRHLSVRLIT